MEYFPITVKLQEQPCLIVGGGEIACRKLKSLLKADAKVSLVALEFSEEVLALAKQRGLKLYQEPFREYLLDDAYLAVAATDIKELNQQVSVAARSRNIWVNVVDDLELSTFIMPAIIDRSPLLVAVSTGGVSPVLARKIRETIEWLFPKNLGGLLRRLKQFRPLVKKKFPSLKNKRDFSEWYIENAIENNDVLSQGFSDVVSMYERQAEPVGKVYLVGAGPGDAELLTVKALKVLQKADIVLHDALVSDDILEQVRRDATLVNVGKRAKKHSVVQTETNRLLVHYANQGLTVVRLKGGDPFIYGRGGEELLQLVQAGVNYEVIPGITAASGCSSYAGIPLTHREYSQTVMFITAHCKNSEDSLNWQSLAREQQTVVVYMGLLRNETLSEQLIKHGRNASTPIALIENGTLPQQRVITGVLKDLPLLVRQHDIVSPSLIVIGEVAVLANDLGWFEKSQLITSNSHFNDTCPSGQYHDIKEAI
ncbi:siroheme synthase CysG [Kangiella sediminilitoris]|uniref:Siroheme synthase n=1 Tax=Kangiella sediminilitoris TaxID=1144748 RepID=A0A1B3BB78_9GAMM|nr:siroheme synthase CysG [Kangiella sediminilitoris]AOE50045.1 Siroheme synthase [Kangiella sediminilitoris]